MCVLLYIIIADSNIYLHAVVLGMAMIAGKTHYNPEFSIYEHINPNPNVVRIY